MEGKVIQMDDDFRRGGVVTGRKAGLSPTTTAEPPADSAREDVERSCGCYPGGERQSTTTMRYYRKIYIYV